VTTQNTPSNTTEKIDPGVEENVISSIVIKAVATLAVGAIAWYFIQNMI